MRSGHWKRAPMLLLAAMLIFLVGCSGGSSGANASTAAGESGDEPQGIEKIKVSIWDRGNAPEGMKITDTIHTRWINEQMKPLGVEVELVPLPRAEENAKLNTWMASGTAPDVVLAYSVETFLKFAAQGGLAELDASIEKYGQDMMANNKLAMESAGTYGGKRYAVMANRPSTGGSVMKIRADWLKKLGMDIPTNVEELYGVLKAFKEKNPGGVDNVIPYSIPSFDRMIHFGISLGMGVDMAGPGTTLYMASGNVVDGKFVSHVATPEGRKYFEFLNKLYQEALLPKEFITDINGRQHSENITSGRVGFIEDNEPSFGLDGKTRELAGANWEIVPPFLAPDGQQQHNAGYPFGMFIMVPKTSEAKTDAVIKYLNWMSKPEVLVTLFSGFEGEHYKVENGLRVAIDFEKNQEDFGWYASDLGIMSLGLPEASEELTRAQYADRNPDFVEDLLQHREVVSKHAVYQPLLTNPRPWTEKNVTAMDMMLLEELSKVIIADDFNAAYDGMLNRWMQMGGETYDQEITEGLKQNGVIE